MKRRILKGRVKFLSFCPRGANTLGTIFKSDEPDAFRLDLLTKDMTEKGELLAVVYAPELRDSQGDIASAEVIKQMFYESSRDGMELDLRHDNTAIPREKAYIAERFLVQKNDPRFADFKDYDGNPVDVTDAWAVVVKIEDEGLRKLYREGAWDGISMGGDAAFEATDKSEKSAEDVATLVAEKLAAKLNPPGEDTMTDEQLAKLTKDLITGLKPAEVKKDETPKPKPAEGLVFKGDPTNAKDVAAHSLKLAKAKILKDVDFSDPDSVAAYSATLTKDSEDEGKTELEKAQAKILKLEGASAQGSAAPTGPAKLRKDYTPEEEAAYLTNLGKGMGQAQNKLNGYAVQG